MRRSFAFTLLAFGGIAIAATAAVAGSGVGSVFNLGKVNTVDGTTWLTGTKAEFFKVTNKATTQVSSAIFATSAGGTGVVATSPWTGVNAAARGTTGLNYGLFATSASVDGFAGYFQNKGSTSGSVGTAVVGLSAAGTEARIHPGAPTTMQRGSSRVQMVLSAPLPGISHPGTA